DAAAPAGDCPLAFARLHRGGRAGEPDRGGEGSEGGDRRVSRGCYGYRDQAAGLTWSVILRRERILHARASKDDRHDASTAGAVRPPSRLACSQGPASSPPW